MSTIDPAAADRPQAGTALLEYGFVAIRAKLLEVAAFLDRAERYGVADDFRCEALRRALPILLDGDGERARRVLEALSDPTTEPAGAAGGKAAFGAWRATE